MSKIDFFAEDFRHFCTSLYGIFALCAVLDRDPFTVAVTYRL